MSNTKKRRFNQLNTDELKSECNGNEPMSKRPRLHEDSKLIIKSHLFPNENDQNQFKLIFESIDASQLINNLHITHYINKEIAEFANGEFKECANKQCDELISILKQDAKIYNNDHNNGHKIGYKYCDDTEKYYCGECMDETKENVCTGCCSHSLLHIPSSDQCGQCDNYIHDYCCGPMEECFLCGDRVCFEHNDYVCVACHEKVCSDCSITYESYEENEECVCNKCCDESNYETMITCKKCKISCSLLHESINHIYPKIGVNAGMEKCNFKNCNTWICLNCKEEDQIGSRHTYAFSTIGRNLFCNIHPVDRIRAQQELSWHNTVKRAMLSMQSIDKSSKGL